MRPLTLFLLTVLALSASAARAQSPAEPRSPVRAETPAPPVVKPADAANTTAPAATETSTAVPAASGGAAPAVASAAQSAPAATQPGPASQGPDAAELLARITSLEQALIAQRTREIERAVSDQRERDRENEKALLAQRDREISLYRETNRLVTAFGVAFALIGLAALVVAAWLTYRGLTAGQHAGPAPTANPAGGNGLMMARQAGVPGIERVQASGQRFQNRMSSLEQRLSELEHLAGREVPVSSHVVPASAAAGEAEHLDGSPVMAESAGPAPAAFRRVVPKAAILVQKALTQMNLGKLTEALATIDEAIAADGNGVDAHLARGQIMEKTGRLPDAIESYDLAIVADATNTNALLMKAGVLNRQERFAEALACYERALEVHRAQS
jgi:tetratricopeptide (TPR) repeat protein